MSLTEKLLEVAAGQKNVYDAGIYDAGYHNGHEDGYETGYTEGEEEGYNEGYSEGYEAGGSGLEGIVITDNRARLQYFYEDLNDWEYFRWEYNEDYGGDVPIENEDLETVDLPFPKGTKNIKNFSYFANVKVSVWDSTSDMGVPARIFTGVLDVAGATFLSYAFTDCRWLEDSGQIVNTSNVQHFGSMYSNCYKLKTVCEMDLSGATDVDYMFSSCYELENVPLKNIPALAAYRGMFSNCKKLKNLPALDLSKAYGFNNMFSGCESLETAPENIGKVNSANLSLSSMFSGCKSLKTIPTITLNANASYTSAFYNCSALENLTIAGVIGQNNFDVSYSPLLTHDSLMSIINHLQKKTSGTYKLKLGATNLAKLTEEEKLMITNKGWQVS